MPNRARSQSLSRLFWGPDYKVTKNDERVNTWTKKANITIRELHKDKASPAALRKVSPTFEDRTEVQQN